MNDFRRCLLELDVPGIRAAWAKQSPYLPQTKSDADALVELHYARTVTQSIPLKLRAYSHRWLLSEGYLSGLPDELKPMAERLYPVVADGVGIAVVAGSSLTKPIVPLVRQAMSNAVLECYADGHREAEIVRPRMLEARAMTVRKLLGINAK